MGLFDDSTRKLDGRHLKPEGLAGHYEIYEGYDEGVRRRAARLRLEAALDREALAMGAIGLALGLALGAAMAWGRGRR